MKSVIENTRKEVRKVSWYIFPVERFKELVPFSVFSQTTLSETFRNFQTLSGTFRHSISSPASPG